MILDVSLETERLVLRRFRQGDIEPMIEMDSDPRVRRYIGDGSMPKPEKLSAEVRRWVESPEKDYGRLGFWAVTVKPDDAFRGWACLNPRGDGIEVGYRLPVDVWGRGYATEAARRLLDYGFDTCGLEEIFAITHPDNRASQRVLEKAGLLFRRMTTFEGQPVTYYTVTRSDRTNGNVHERP